MNLQEFSKLQVVILNPQYPAAMQCVSMYFFSTSTLCELIYKKEKKKILFCLLRTFVGEGRRNQV